MKQPDCPECEKLSAVHEESQKLGLFLDWLFSTNGTLCQFRDAVMYDEDGEITSRWSENVCSDPEGFYPNGKSIEKILAEYFEIDLNKVEKERSALLEYIRKQ